MYLILCVLTCIVLYTLAELNKLIKKITRRMAKAPTRGTIQPKKRVQSTQSEAGPPTIFPLWAVHPDHHPRGECSTPTATPTPTVNTPATCDALQLEESHNSSTNSDSSSYSSD